MAATAALALAGLSSAATATSGRLEVLTKPPEAVEELRLVTGGVLWSDRHGLSLTGARGTRPLVPFDIDEAHAPYALFDDGWTVLVRYGRPPAVGRRAKHLLPVTSLRECAAFGEPPERAWRVAVANGSLYTIVLGRCVGRGPNAGSFLVRVPLGTDTIHLIGRVPRHALALAVTGNLLALTYEPPRTPHRVRVDIRDARDARLLYRVSAPPGLNGRRARPEATQLDGRGDVLVTGTRDPPPLGSFVPFAWWGNADARVGRTLVVKGTATTALADGRIAYVTTKGGVEHIDVLDLATRRTRTVVAFPGSARVEALALRGTRLAWAQQNYGQVAQDGCRERAAAGPPEILATSLPGAGPPLLDAGATVPTVTGPACVEINP